MEYSILKDSNPLDTVNKIKEILNDVGISVEEYIQERKFQTDATPYSCRISTFGISRIGVNGKGTSKLNALASGYGEYMERLQNQAMKLDLDSNDFYVVPDEIIEKKSNICDSVLDDIRINKKSLEYLDEISRTYTFFSKFVKEETNKENTILIPFYNVLEKKIYNFPLSFFKIYHNSNGMAAGNTIEEAMVQGLSEICERHALETVIKNKLILPDIPSELYMKYDNIRGMIEYCEQNNWHIKVKDASMGKGLPVVSMIFENQNHEFMCLGFGAHPSLPIAIERTITEFMQGLDISDQNIVKGMVKFYSNEHFEFDLEKDVNIIIHSMFQGRTLFKSNSYFKDIYHNNNFSYDFSEKNWNLSQDGLSNKIMLNNLLQEIKKITNKIYVRDVSFLGFPSVRIYIPELSYLIFKNEEDIKSALNYVNWLYWMQYDDSNLDLSIESLIEAIEYSGVCENQFDKLTLLPMPYLSFLCAIIKEDHNKINEAIEILVSENEYYRIFNEVGLKRLYVVSDYFELKQKGFSLELIKTELSKKYPDELVENALKLIFGTTFDGIKKMLKKPFEQSQRTDDIELLNKIKAVQVKLGEKYKENCPNQMDLRKVFEFIT